MGLAISADSRYIAATCRPSLTVWDLDGPDLKPIVTSHEWAGYPQFLNQSLLFRDEGHRWRSLDLSRGRWSVFAPMGAVVNVFAVSPSGEVVLALDGEYGFSCWRMGESEPREVWSAPWSPTRYSPVFFSADSRSVSAEWGVYSTTVGGRVVSLRPPEAVATPTLFTPDGRTILGKYQNRVYSFDAVADGKNRLLIRHPQKRHFRSLAVHPAGSILGAVTTDDAVSFYDLASGELTRTYAWKLGKLKDLVFTPDGTRCVVSGSRGRVLLFDVE